MPRLNIIVTRTQPGGEAFAAALRALGHEAACVPLLAAEAVQDPAPDADPDAVIITSAHALPHALAYRQKPLYAVGAGTATAARAAGWDNVIDGPGDVAGLARILPPGQTLLHLAGEHLAAETEAVLAPLNVLRRTVYRTVPTGLENRVFGQAGKTVVTLHSPRAAAILGAYVRTYQPRMPADGIIFLCLSQGVLESFGIQPAGTARLYVDTPTEDAMIKALGSLI